MTNAPLILVTGAGGFIGSNILAHLAARGVRVVACDRFGAGDKWRNIARHEVHDILPPEGLFPWLEREGAGLAGIVHMGAISATTETDVDLILRENVETTLRLWTFCARASVRLVYASSAATYGDGHAGFDDDGAPEALARLKPLNPYGWSKHVVDRRIARDVAQGHPTPPHWAGLKFFNVYGPNEYHKGPQRSVAHQMFESVRDTGRVRLFRSHREGIPDGGQRRDFVHVDDCAEAVTWLLSAPVSGLFNLGTGQARSFLDLAHAVFAAMGREPAIDFIPTPEPIRAHYQYFTEARMARLRAAGFDRPFRALEDGVADYVGRYLASADPYR